MKITGYQQSITNVSGSGGAPTLNLSASAKATANSAPDLSPVIKGIGGVVDTMNYVHEQEDKANILAAMDSYNQNVNDLMHNETDGLMNTKEQGAAGITDKYLEATKKIKGDVLGNTKLHFRGNQQALDNFFNKASEQGFEQVRAHQYRQNQIVQDNHLTNLKNSAFVSAGDNYNNAAALSLGKVKLGLAVDLRYAEFGPERIEAEKQKAYGEYGNAAMQAAMANNDIQAQQEIFKEYGQYMTAQQRANYQKLSYKKQETNWQYSVVDQAVAQGNLAAALKYIDNINFREEKSIAPSGSIAQQAAQAAQYVSEKTGIPANLIFAQWKLESGNFSSQLTKENLNLGGLTQTTPNGEDNKQPDGNNYYKKYGSVQEYADDYINSFIKYYKFDPADIKSPEAFAKLLKDNGYYGASLESYTNGIKNGLSDFDSALKSGGEASTRQVPIEREEKEHLRNMVISKMQQNKSIEDKGRKELQDDIMQQAYEAKQNGMTADVAVSTFADMKKYSDAKDYDAVVAAVSHVFGIPTKNVKSLTGLRTKGKGDAMAVYEMKKLIEANTFEGDRTMLMNYLNSPDCSDLKDTQKKKILEVFDDFTEKKGTYKYDWSKVDNRILNGAKLPADEKERILAQGQAYALNLIKTWKPSEHQGRQYPTDEEVIAAAQEGVNKNYMTTYEEPGRIWGTNTKEFAVNAGALARAGFYGGMADVPGTDMVNLYFDEDRTKAISISKDELRRMFPNVKG